MVRVIQFHLFFSPSSSFGQDQCYPLAFGVPALLMFVALGVFLSGRRGYRRVAPTGSNVLVSTGRIVWSALRSPATAATGFSIRSLRWLDRAEALYGAAMVADVKQLFRVMIVLSMAPFFWAGFDQQATR